MLTDQPECYADDFLEQILAFPTYPLPINGDNSVNVDVSNFHGSMYPLGLSLDNTLPSHEPELECGQLFGRVHPYSVPVQQSDIHDHQEFRGQPNSVMIAAAAQPPAVRPRVRARRGQATDPHSIAERVRRERISEKVKALQELVPSCSKTDRAAMLDGILDYVKFLRLQVKVLSMSRMGGAGAVAQLVSDVQLPSIEREASESRMNQQPWDKWSNDATEQEVLKLMEEDVGAAMQYLQSKALCIMPVSLAEAIYPTQQPDTSSLLVKLESDPPISKSV